MIPLQAEAIDPEFAPVDPFEMGGDVVPMVSKEVLALRKTLMTLQRIIMLPNCAEAFSEDQLSGLGQQVVREYKIDKDSRTEWETTARRAMDMAKQKKETKSTPWEGASNVKYPLLTTAALQFAARAYPAIVDGPRIVKGQVMGYDPDGMKAGKADRVSQHMSYQLLYELENWESDVDTALHQIPIIGCAFKKVYENENSKAGFSDDLVSAFDYVVNQRTKSLETVPRGTHVFPLYPHEIEERKASGYFLDVKLVANESGEDDDAPHQFLEQHRYWDADGDGVREPWIVTVHEDTGKVVRIKPNFVMDGVKSDAERGRIISIKRKQYFVMIPFIPDPEGGFYAIGFGKLLESLSDVIDTSINQMMDAGTLQNAGGGLIGGGIQLNKAKIKLRPGEYQSVPNTGQDLKNNIVNLEHPGPSSVLFELLGMMIESGKDIAAVKDVLTGETPTNQTATSTMAAIEQGLKVFTAIYKRIFRALKHEYKLIFEINKATINQPKYVNLLDDPVTVNAQDYDDSLDVMPVSDPNTVTDMQRMAKAQFVMEQVANGNPHVDPFKATMRAFEAARIDNPKDLLIPPTPKPADELQLKGMAAEVDKVEAQADQARAGAEKARVDSVVALATAAIPPQIVPQIFPMPFADMGGNQAGYAPPMPPMPMMDDGIGMPTDQGMPQMMPQDAGVPISDGVPPELMQREGGALPPMQ